MPKLVQKKDRFSKSEGKRTWTKIYEFLLFRIGSFKRILWFAFIYRIPSFDIAASESETQL
ncbi:hypothetical protein BpHYR1_033890 [Brachionus plicatilis]|uniref:Uncharacterized protein n=1 Tax=Brachionus plicatilis TaxID=10195 RepID=A0A3M7S6M6_BRAPC|nr:hypothetical protein BpHYR1_033890 [Brachionus plicatilis]